MTTLDRAIPAADRSGVFITLEGPDGAGKSTLAKIVADRLRTEGFEIAAVRDPGGTPLGDRIRSLLLDRSDLSISLRAEMFLYMASRAQLVDDVIAPALAAGKVVICDRFLLSNVVYQGYAGGLEVAEIWRIGRTATRGLTPDLTLVIDVPREIARKRVSGSRDRIEDRDEAYKERVRDGFLAAARGEAGFPGELTGTIRLIDGSADLDTVSDRLMCEVLDVLAKRARS